MKEAVSDILAARAQDPGGASRLFGYSLAVHLAIGSAIVFMPSEWFSSQAAKPNVMEVSLGGAIGERTTGSAPISARRVEEAVPETKRPEPIKVAPPPKPDVMPTPAAKVEPPKTPPKPTEKPPVAGPPSPAKPPVTGKQVQAGTAVTDTGSTTQGPGITVGGGRGGGGDVDLNTFDQVWVGQMRDAIQKNWNNEQPEKGWTEILFVLDKNGKVLKREVSASSGSFILNIEAERAIARAVIPPLPRDFNEPTLAVRLRFNYGVR